MEKIHEFVLRCIAISIVVMVIGIIWESLSTNESNHAGNYCNCGRNNGLINNTKD